MLSFGDITSLARISWSAASSLWRIVRRHQRNLSAQEKLELRNKWKPQFRQYIAKVTLEELRTDVIIRDMRRMDSYPQIPEGKGISPWFRLSLLDTYGRGIMVGLGWEELIEEPGLGFRYADIRKGETGSGRNVMLTGYIPFENIESVDWEGDHYYDYPHIYCYFIFKGGTFFGRQPYERLAFCEEHRFHGPWRSYSDFAEYESVRKAEQKTRHRSLSKEIVEPLIEILLRAAFTSARRSSENRIAPAIIRCCCARRLKTQMGKFDTLAAAAHSC
jgi:hypothetical protein